MRRHSVALGIAALGILGANSGCSSRAAQSTSERRSVTSVRVASATREDVPIRIQAIGTTEPFLTVAVRARVSGQIERVYFEQGADVRDGDLLFKIDPRPYQNVVDQATATLARDTAAVRQAEAATARDRATERNAEAQSARYEELFNQGIVSREQYDQFQSNRNSQAAAVRADEENVAVASEAVRLDRARLTDAQLQLSFTEIHAPISGRTGNLNVQVGNLVKDQDSTPLVVINQISPIYVSFSVPEVYLSQVRSYSQSGKLAVHASPPQTNSQTEMGVLDFIDNSVDTATGTIRLKALFQNTGRRLWPGQFVNVSLDLTVEHGAVVVPSSAVQTGQQGQYVLSVDQNLIAHQRGVRVGPATGGNVVILSGISPGDRVITDGQLGVTDGARVQLIGQSSATLGQPAQ